MDIRGFFGKGNSEKKEGSNVPTATLSDLRKKTSANTDEVPARRTSPRKAQSSSKTASKAKPVKQTKGKKGKTHHDDDIEDDIITLSSPDDDCQGAKKHTKTKKKIKHEEKKVEEEKTKKKQFQLLDDEDLDVDDPDDDFVITYKKSPKKKTGRKRGKGAVDVDDPIDDNDDGEEEIVRKKKRAKNESDDESHKKKARGGGKRKEPVRVLDSDNEDDESEDMKEAKKHERQHKAAMKRAMRPDSQGLRNQDIKDVVETTTIHGSTVRKGVEPKRSEEKVSHKVKDMSAADFFGTGAVKYEQERKNTVESEQPKESESMEVDNEDEKTNHSTKEVERISPEKTPERKHHKTPEKRKTPSQHGSAKKTPKHSAEKPGAKSEEYVLHAPLTPKSDNSSHGHKKHEHEKTPTNKTTVTTPESAVDKRRSSYFSYLHREGPKHLGERDLPTGSPTLLEGLTFVFTGVLDSFEREDLKIALEKMGARVVGSVSKKTSYVVVGREAGQSKLDKIKQLKVPQLNEETLLELIDKQKGAAPAKEKPVETQEKKKHQDRHHHHEKHKEESKEKAESPRKQHAEPKRKEEPMEVSLSQPTPQVAKKENGELILFLYTFSVTISFQIP